MTDLSAKDFQLHSHLREQGRRLSQQSHRGLALWTSCLSSTLGHEFCCLRRLGDEGSHTVEQLMSIAVCSLRRGIFTYCQKMLGVVSHISGK